MTLQDKLTENALKAVEQAMAKEPRSTPEGFDCWFCGQHILRDYPGNQELCDRMLCVNCAIEDEHAAKINAAYAEVCAELVALRQYRARVKPHCMSVRVDLIRAEAQFQKFENPVNPVNPASANTPMTGKEVMEEAIGRKYNS